MGKVVSTNMQENKVESTVVPPGGQSWQTTTDFLAHATTQADERGLWDFTIVDADAHHMEEVEWAEVTEYIEDEPLREWSRAYVRRGGVKGGVGIMPSQIGGQNLDGRITRPGQRETDIASLERSMAAMAIDYTVLFPTTMLFLGLHPRVDVEVHLSWAYTRWLVEHTLAADNGLVTLAYLPFGDPDACLRVVETYADHPSVVGFMVTSVRQQPVHAPAYAKLYRAIEETGKPLGFHTAYDWQGPVFGQLNRFISAHALGFTVHNMIHLTNMVINGLPERFPDLKVLWIESGLAWVPFLMQRLDNEYMMRMSEAPLLKNLPSEYMRRFFYTTQPIERTNNREALEVTFKMMDAENQLLYASDYPHWDFDLPSRIFDIPFLSAQGRTQILGGNAQRLFDLPDRHGARAARR